MDSEILIKIVDWAFGSLSPATIILICILFFYSKGTRSQMKALVEDCKKRDGEAKAKITALEASLEMSRTQERTLMQQIADLRVEVARLTTRFMGAN